MLENSHPLAGIVSHFSPPPFLVITCRWKLLSHRDPMCLWGFINCVTVTHPLSMFDLFRCPMVSEIIRHNTNYSMNLFSNCLCSCPTPIIYTEIPRVIPILFPFTCHKDPSWQVSFSAHAVLPVGSERPFLVCYSIFWQSFLEMGKFAQSLGWKGYSHDPIALCKPKWVFPKVLAVMAILPYYHTSFDKFVVYYLFSGDGTQGFMNASQIFYHWALCL